MVWFVLEAFFRVSGNSKKRSFYDGGSNSAKDEGLGACAQTRVRRRMFLVFPIMVGGVSCDEVTTKNTFCHVAIMRCLVKFVVLQSHSQSTCVLNQCHIRINTHLVSHIETSCFFFYFFPHDLSHCCLCFHSTVLAHFCFWQADLYRWVNMLPSVFFCFANI